MMRPHLILFFFAASLACTHEHRTGATGDAVEPAYPRFWLVKTSVVDAPGGKEVAEVVGPRLVEFLPGGRVRSIKGSLPPFDGYLPRDVLDEPRERRGLMLYAQTVGDMSCYWPGG